MTQLRELYRCDICGNVAEIVHTGAPALVCCEQPMGKVTEKSEEAGKEKHAPVVKTVGEGITVSVGSMEHPMEEKHAIQFIEVLTAGQVLRAELTVGQKPTAEFNIKKEDVLEVRAYCNLHGLWKR